MIRGRIVNCNNIACWSYSISQRDGEVTLSRTDLEDLGSRRNPPDSDEPLAMLHGSNVMIWLALIKKVFCHLFGRAEEIRHGLSCSSCSSSSLPCYTWVALTDMREGE